MTAIVGILNVTPDSFGTPPLAPEEAFRAAQRLIAAGADVIDVGAESTRPGATAVAPEDEWERLAPALAAIVAAAHVEGRAVSLDTRHPLTAARGLEAGVDWINDVSGCGPEMAATVAPATCRVVVMHALAVPPVPGAVLPGPDPVAYLHEWFARRLDVLEAAGIARSRVIVDPGIGFGTSPHQALAVIARAHEFARHAPVLVGHSRKRFLAPLADGEAPEARDAPTLALSAAMAATGVAYLRVHDVARHRAALAALAGG